MPDLRLYKITSGEEIIGRFEEEKDDVVILSTVRLMTLQRDENTNQTMVAMVPWMLGAPDSKLAINKRSIVGEVSGTLSKNLEDGYLHQTTGIALSSTATSNKN